MLYWQLLHQKQSEFNNTGHFVFGESPTCGTSYPKHGYQGLVRGIESFSRGGFNTMIFNSTGMTIQDEQHWDQHWLCLKMGYAVPPNSSSDDEPLE